MFCIFTFELLVEQCECNATREFSLISKGIKSLCNFTVIFIYFNVSVFVYKVFFVHYFLAKLLHKLVKTLYCELFFHITYILSNLSMSDVILKQLLQVFSSSLKFLAITKSWQKSLHFLENVLYINRSRCGFPVSMSTPSKLIFCSNRV